MSSDFDACLYFSIIKRLHCVGGSSLSRRRARQRVVQLDDSCLCRRSCLHVLLGRGYYAVGVLSNCVYERRSVSRRGRARLRRLLRLIRRVVVVACERIVLQHTRRAGQLCLGVVVGLVYEVGQSDRDVALARLDIELEDQLVAAELYCLEHPVLHEVAAVDVANSCTIR